MKGDNGVEIYFPGWTRKSVTFTIDDGHIAADARFLSIVKPHGIVGTFNLTSPNRATPEEYRELYFGYEIANHCKNHPLCFDEGQPYVVSDQPFDRNNSSSYTPENPVVYKTEVENVYRIHKNLARIKPDGWSSITDRESYACFARESRAELEEIFGKGSVKSFVWPYYEQTNELLFRELCSMGYNSIRKTGAVGSSTSFDFPADRMRWSYNATNRTLLSVMAEYEDYPDDGRLKFFSFGVHSHDFERDNNWCDLEAFSEKYGNRPEDYYYATVSELFEYEDAVKALVITDGCVTNPTEKTVYLKIKGKKIILNRISSIPILG